MQLIKCECKKVLCRYEFWAVILLSVLLSFIGLLQSTTGWDTRFFTPLHIWAPSEASMLDKASIGTMLLFIMPFLATLPCACLYFEECASRTVSVQLTRTTPGRYFGSKLIVTAVTAFGVSVLPYLLNLAFCLVAFPLGRPHYFTNDVYNTYSTYAADRSLFPALLMNHPVLDTLAHIGLVGLFGLCMALLSYAITLFFQRHIVVALGATTILAMASLIIFQSLGWNRMVIQGYLLTVPYLPQTSLMQPLLILAVPMLVVAVLVLLKIKYVRDVFS